MHGVLCLPQRVLRATDVHSVVIFVEIVNCKQHVSSVILEDFFGDLPTGVDEKLVIEAPVVHRVWEGCHLTLQSDGLGGGRSDQLVLHVDDGFDCKCDEIALNNNSTKL